MRSIVTQGINSVREAVKATCWRIAGAGALSTSSTILALVNNDCALSKDQYLAVVEKRASSQ
jgi:hypothetical protein